MCYIVCKKKCMLVQWPLTCSRSYKKTKIILFTKKVLQYMHFIATGLVSVVNAISEQQHSVIGITCTCAC